jgi:hypothetical protein
VQPGGSGAVAWLFRVRTPVVYIRRASNLGGTPQRRSLSPSPNPRLAQIYTAAIAAVSRFGAGGAWVRSGDSLLVHADGYSGEVTWYAVGNRGATVTARGLLGRSGREATPEDVQAETDRLNGMALAVRGRDPSSADSLDFAAELLGAPTRWSVATTAIAADDGAVWIGINRIYHVAVDAANGVRVGEDNTWAVFPASGEAFTVTLRPLFRLTAVAGGRLYGFVDEGAGESRIAVYTLR